MRLLHTSDWHLGRTFHGQSLLADQEAVLGAVADLVAEHGVDVVLISGDIYDRAVPSPEAVQCATRILARIRRAGSTIVAISGNHDSAPRLGAFADFLASGGLHLRTAASAVGAPVELDDGHGPVAVYPVPYLEPDLARGLWELPSPAGHQHVLAAALGEVRADLARRPAGTRSIVLAHAFVTGAVAGGSERSIAVGGVESVSAELFEGFDYVALGHLHGAQQVTERIRYSGSPLPYAFTEAGHHKCVWLVDLGADGAVDVRRLELPVIRGLATVRGRLADILDGHADLVDHYLSVELTDPVRPLEPMRRLRERFPHVMVTQWLPEPTGGSADGTRRPPTGHRADAVLVTDFVTTARGSAPSGGERLLLQQALAAERLVERAR
ncbi:exonuclease SbcCD subunit D [Nakamurella sp. GG22]